ncbi:MAG: TetR/AcrR family transcriptional regulator [Gammaproteobacteria bacterium]|nr:MAG: TetR/AcrR family transcriptional regulator [Gammaproteobacteria bacterium]
MPKQVDADARRGELAAATRRVILRRGLEGSTLREVAREAGWSIGVLAHYFETKDELLRYSLADPAWVMNRFDSTEPDGLTSVRRILERLLPLSSEMRDMWQVWMTFWVSWPGDASWDRERRQRQRKFRRFCRGLILHVVERGEFDARIDAERDGDALATLLHGLGVQAVLDPRGWPQRRQLEALDAFFAARLPSGSVEVATCG